MRYSIEDMSTTMAHRYHSNINIKNQNNQEESNTMFVFGEDYKYIRDIVTEI